MTIIGELAFDLSYTQEKMVAKLFAPEESASANSWICRFEIGSPIDYALNIHGASSLQAIILAIKGISATLYSSDVYKEGQLGVFGEFGGDLTIPAPNVFLDVAPYPF